MEGCNKVKKFPQVQCDYDIYILATYCRSDTIRFSVEKNIFLISY